VRAAAAVPASTAAPPRPPPASPPAPPNQRCSYAEATGPFSVGGGAVVCCPCRVGPRVNGLRGSKCWPVAPQRKAPAASASSRSGVREVVAEPSAPPLGTALCHRRDEPGHLAVENPQLRTPRNRGRTSGGGARGPRALENSLFFPSPAQAALGVFDRPRPSFARPASARDMPLDRPEYGIQFMYWCPARRTGPPNARAEMAAAILLPGSPARPPNRATTTRSGPMNERQPEPSFSAAASPRPPRPFGPCAEEVVHRASAPPPVQALVAALA